MRSISRLYTSKLGKVVLGALAGGGMLLGATTATASSLTSAQISAITVLLQSFNVGSGTIANVQSVLSGGTASTTGPSGTSQITGVMIGFLHKGDHGQGVCYLHALLATDPTISVNITANDTGGNCPFGPLTENALKNFQNKHGIAAVGFVGPQTLAAIQQLLANNPLGVENDEGNTASSTGEGNQGNHGHRVCAIVPPGHLIAPGWLRHHNNEMPVVPTCQILPPGILGLLGGGQNGSTTPGTALSVSSVTSSGVTATDATITWWSNIAATSQVEYGTTTSYGTLSSLNSSLVASHSVALAGLTPSTTYHFRVWSTVGSQTATSSDMTFTTSAALDTTAPVISNVASSSVAAASATVTWTTNENATSKVYYSTSSPIDFGSAPSATVAGLMTSHSVILTGLTASTTYSFAAVSADASNNTATSSTLSFTTTP